MWIVNCSKLLIKHGSKCLFRIKKTKMFLPLISSKIFRILIYEIKDFKRILSKFVTLTYELIYYEIASVFKVIFGGFQGRLG